MGVLFCLQQTWQLCQLGLMAGTALSYAGVWYHSPRATQICIR